MVLLFDKTWTMPLTDCKLNNNTSHVEIIIIINQRYITGGNKNHN